MRPASWRTALATLAAGAILHAGVARAASEDALKAAFLSNFANYVEWPESAFENTRGTLVICILGADLIAAALESRVSGVNDEERPFEVRRSPSVDRLGACHMIFVGYLEESRWPNLARAIEGHSVLTVGDSEEFLKRGGMMTFAMEEGKLRFEINYDTVQKAGLKMSSQLLKLARRVISTTMAGVQS